MTSHLQRKSKRDPANKFNNIYSRVVLYFDSGVIDRSRDRRNYCSVRVSTCVHVLYHAHYTRLSANRCEREREMSAEDKLRINIKKIKVDFTVI